MSRVPVLAVVLPVLLLPAVVAVAPAQAGSLDLRSSVAANAVGQRHADVVKYWTPERVAAAAPADVVLGADGKRVAAKGKPGGGGTGGGTATVAGASWTGRGAVLKTTGKVLFTMSASNYVCSGSVVQDGVAGRALVLTAGHCVYDDVANAFATNWMFVPDFDSAPTFTCANTVYGCWTASSLVSTTQWGNSDFNHDVGFAVLGAGGKTAAQVDDVVGAQAIAFSTVHPTQVFAFGYPAAAPWTGNDLVYSAGVDTKDVWGGSTDYSLASTLTGGSSGGPWFRDFNQSTGVGTLTSVNSFTYRGVKNRMFGPYLGPVAASTFSAAKVAAANSLVTG